MEIKNKNILDNFVLLFKELSQNIIVHVLLKFAKAPFITNYTDSVIEIKVILQ